MNFNTLLAEMQSEVNDTSDRTKTRLVGWINDGIAAICIKRRWAFLRIQESDEEDLSSANTPMLFSALDKGTTNVPAKFITNIYDVTDGVRTFVPKITYENLGCSDYSSTENAPPLGWYQSNDKDAKKQVQFFPPLSTDVRTFVFSYVIQVNRHVSTSVLRIVIPDEYIHVLKSYIQWRVDKFNSDDRADGSFNEYQQGIMDMIRDCSIYSEINSDDNGVVDRFSNGVTGV